MATGANDALCSVERFKKEPSDGDSSTLQSASPPPQTAEKAQKDSLVVAAIEHSDSLEKEPESVKTAPTETFEKTNGMGEQGAEGGPSVIENPCGDSLDVAKAKDLEVHEITSPCSPESPDSVRPDNRAQGSLECGCLPETKPAMEMVTNSEFRPPNAVPESSDDHAEKTKGLVASCVEEEMSDNVDPSPSDVSDGVSVDTNLDIDAIGPQMSHINMDSDEPSAVKADSDEAALAVIAPNGNGECEDETKTPSDCPQKTVADDTEQHEMSPAAESGKPNDSMLSIETGSVEKPVIVAEEPCSTVKTEVVEETSALEDPCPANKETEDTKLLGEKENTPLSKTGNKLSAEASTDQVKVDNEVNSVPMDTGNVDVAFVEQQSEAKKEKSTTEKSEEAIDAHGKDEGILDGDCSPVHDSDPVDRANVNTDTPDEPLKSKHVSGEQDATESTEVCLNTDEKKLEDEQSVVMRLPAASDQETQQSLDIIDQGCSTVKVEKDSDCNDEEPINGNEVEDTEAQNNEIDEQEKVVDARAEEPAAVDGEVSKVSQLEPEAEYRHNEPPSNDVANTSNQSPPIDSDSGIRKATDSKPDPPELEKIVHRNCASDENSLVCTDETTGSCAEVCEVAESAQAHDSSDPGISGNLEIPKNQSDSACTGKEDATENTESAKEKETTAIVSENLAKEKTCNHDDDEYSYEEIVLDDDEEVVEYVDEILNEYEEAVDDSSFTEVTYDSRDNPDDALQQSRGSLTVESSTKRAVIKSSAQKALEQEEAMKLQEADETRKNMEFRLARQHSFAKKDADLKRRLAEEEERHIREEEEREQQRIAEEERMAEIRAQEAAARIAQQQTAELRRRLEEEEARRRLAEAEAHRLAAEAAAKEKAEAEKLRREAEEAERLEREEKRRQMEEEVRILQEKLAATKHAAEEAKAKQLEEKKRMEAMVEARRKEKKLKKKKKVEAKVPCEISSDSHTLPVPVASKSKHQLSPLRPIGSLTKESAARSPVGTPKSPLQVSPRRFVPSSPAQCVSPLKMHQPQVASPAPASKVASPIAAAPPPVPKVSEEHRETTSDTDKVYYTADQLRKQSVPGLDYKNREQYLHPKEFQEIFGMTRDEFLTLPKWKQTNMKRKKKLF